MTKKLDSAVTAAKTEKPKKTEKPAMPNIDVDEDTGLKVFGAGDPFVVLGSTVDVEQLYLLATAAMPVVNGCLVKVTEGTLESQRMTVTYVPGVRVVPVIPGDPSKGNKLVSI